MRFLTPIALALLCAPQLLLAQNRGDDFHWERRLAPGQRVHARNINGNITVSPSSSGRVEIVGIRHGSSRSADLLTADVQETDDGIVVCVVRRDSDDECDNNGYHHHSDDDDWGNASLDLDIRIPSSIGIDASSVSGSVDITGAQGDIRAGSVSGDVRLERVRASSVEVRTVSGEITTSIEALTGSGPLSFKTVSGDVRLEVPRNFDADLSMSTVSGDLDSDFQMTLGGGMSRRRIEARIGGGGRRLELSTVSGDVRLGVIR